MQFMPLSLTKGEFAFTETFVSMPARAGEQPATVQVSHEWLRDREAPSAAEPAELLARAETYETEIERVARAKYDGADFALDNGIVIVRIRTGD